MPRCHDSLQRRDEIGGLRTRAGLPRGGRRVVLRLLGVAPHEGRRKTHAQDLNHYHSDHDVDLLVIGFDDTLFEDKQLLEFIQSLSRQNVKNVALINCFFTNNKRLMKVIHLCQNKQLPLMREQYTFKMSFEQRKEINPTIIDNARLYIEDMVNVIRNYY